MVSVAALAGGAVALARARDLEHGRADRGDVRVRRRGRAARGRLATVRSAPMWRPLRARAVRRATISSMSEASLAPPARGFLRREWDAAAASLARPYRVTIPMVLLILLVPCCIFIGDDMRGRPTHTPAIAWDRELPVRPAWALVYGCLYLFLIVLPVLVVR